LPIAFLVVLACVLHFGAKSIEVPDDYRRRSKHAGVVAWLAYLIIHFFRDQVHTFDQLLPFVIHGFLGAVILASTLVWSRNALGVSKRNLRGLFQRRPGRKRAMAELQRSYRQELDLIRSANLRRYERRVAREDAKRRYLRRLRQLLES